MINAKEEFQSHVGGKEVLCAAVFIGGDPQWEHNRVDIFASILKRNHSADDMESFLSRLNVNYDDGFGGQELFGTIWYKDGTWSERGEYDGSEWWEYKSLPDIAAVESLGFGSL